MPSRQINDFSQKGKKKIELVTRPGHNKRPLPPRPLETAGLGRGHGISAPPGGHSMKLHVMTQNRRAGGMIIRGIEAQHGIGLLGLLLFINLMRVG